MDRPDAAPAASDAYILQRLAQAADRDDLILEVCQRNGLDWPAAQALVEAIEARNANQIERKKSPLYFLLSLGAFASGLSLGLAYYLDLAKVFRLATGRTAGLPELFSFAFLYAYDLPLLIMGVTLAAGGLVGLVKSARSMLSRN
jgi:hypothetical protein